MSDDLPIVGRPRGSAWRQLQSEGILWEGQILVAGGDTDLAALLIVTNDRLSLVRGGAIALDIKHDWISAPPVLRRTGTVGLHVQTPGQRLPEALTLIVREGRLAAAELVDVLTPRERYEPEFPTWDSSMFLDEEPIIPARQAPYERKHSPAPVDPLPPFPMYAALDDDDFPPIAPPPDPMPDWSGAPRLTAGAVADPAANVIPRQNDWNLKPLDGMDNKDRRNRRAWAMRIAAILVAIAGVAAWQGGVFPEYSSIRDRFADNTPEIQTVAQVPVGTPTEAPATEPTTAPTKTATAKPTEADSASTEPAESGPSSTQSEPTYAPAEQTAMALGVGGGETDPPDADANAASTQPATTETPVIEPPAAAETPATEQQAPTQTAEQPTETAAEPTVAPTEPAQSVMPTEEPSDAASASSGTLDYEISDVQIGESLPDLTLGPLQNEEWVVVTVDVKNTGSDLATLDMSQFELSTAEGDTLDLDSATGAVAAYLGMTSGNGVKDTREIGAGERAQVVLVFVPPIDATGLTLMADGVSIPLEDGASGQAATASQPQNSGEQTAQDVSPQLLTNTFEQFAIVSPTATANAKIVPLIGNPWETAEE
jgi:hypothetical protein